MLLARAAPTVGGYYGYEHLDALPLPESSRIFHISIEYVWTLDH